MYTTGTVSGQTNTAYYLYNNVVKPFLTSASTWFSFVESYVVGSTTYDTWMSASSANHSGMNWYVTFAYQTPTQLAASTLFTVYAEEVYTTSNHTWNRPVLWSNTGYATAYSTTLFDSANQRAYTAAVPNTVGTVYSSLVGNVGSWAQTFAVASNATVAYYMVANADGFFLSTAVGNLQFVYAGAFSSVLPVGGPLGTDQPLAMMGSLNQNYFGVSRDPLANGTAATAPYYDVASFYGVAYGSVNGQVDNYQSGPWAARVAVGKGSASTAGGYYRGLLPNWVLMLPQTGCTAGDTVTIPGSGGDTYVLTSAYLNATTNLLWVDTNA